MMDNGKNTYKMDMEFVIIQMVKDMKDHIVQDNYLGKELFIILMVISLKGNGQMTKDKDLEHFITRMGKKRSEIIKMENLYNRNKLKNELFLKSFKNVAKH